MELCFHVYTYITSIAVSPLVSFIFRCIAVRVAASYKPKFNAALLLHQIRTNTASHASGKNFIDLAILDFPHQTT